MKRKDPLLRWAMKLQKWSQHHDRPDRRLDRIAESVLNQANLLARQLEASRKAQARGWFAAASRMASQTAVTLEQIRYAVSDALSHAQRPPLPRQPTLRDLYQELAQLRQEFEEVALPLKGLLISAVTEAIELEGVYLGPFRIELHMDRLRDHADISGFDVVALDPHPPSSSEEVTHPHVRDRQLCAGAATAPIALALREGRICDAFLTVHAVLQEYNSASPYVSLSDWDGVLCADCERATDSEHLYYCDDCGRDFCDDCFSCCDSCDQSRCRSCLEEDRESGRRCCRRCRHNCRSRRRIVDADSVDSDTSLCPACHEDVLAEQEAEEPEQQTPTPLQAKEQSNEHAHNHQCADIARREGIPATACPASA